MGGVFFLTLAFCSFAFGIRGENTDCVERSLVGSNKLNIPDSSYTTSSYYKSLGNPDDVRYQPHNAKLNSKYGWGARDNNNPDDYLQIDLGTPRIITAVATQGSGLFDEWVTTYKINHTNNLTKWTSYMENIGGIKLFRGNYDQRHVQKHPLDNYIKARYIRFIPVRYHKHKTMRVNVYIVKKEPLRITSVVPKERSIELQWMISPCRRDDPIKGFTVKNGRRTFDVTYNSSKSYTIQNLKPYTDYEVEVIAITKLGHKFRSGTKKTKTKIAAPEAHPVIEVLQPLSSQSVLIKWKLQQSELVNGPLKGYNIIYTPKGGKTKTVDVGNVTTCTLTSLLKYTTYVITIAVRNAKYIGPRSMERRVRTMEDEPPSFIQKLPKSKTVSEGAQVIFTCNATGSPVPSTVWYKDGQELAGRNSMYQIANDNRTLTITKVDRDDQGIYSCSVSNSIDPSLSSSANLTVNYKPRITKPLTTNKTVVEGKNVSFVCQYDGRPKPKVKWLKDNIEIKPREQDSSRLSISGDGNTLTINKASKYDEGRYECRVTNDLGYDISSVSLAVQYDGKFAVRPRNKTYVEGQKVTLTCNRDHMSKAKIHWFMKKKDHDSEIKISTDEGRLDISQDGTQLTITELRRTDQGSYRCEARYKYERSHSSSYGYVNVNYKPKILQSPPHSVKNEKESVTLSCEFEGKPFPLVTWLKNGQEMDTNSTGRISSTVSHTTQDEYIGTAKLQISMLRREDQGNFSCSTKNKINSSLSKEGFLEIRYPPVIFSSPSNITKNESDQVQLSCTMEGNPKPTVSWQKNGHILDPNEDKRIKLQTIGNASLWESTITIKSVKDTDDGSYCCVATNAATKKTVSSKPGKVVVNFLHDVSITTPNPYILTLGKTEASLQCSAVGFPKPALTWYKEVTIKSASQVKSLQTLSSNHSGGQDGVQLLLTASGNGISYKEAGNYMCEAYSKILNKTTRGTIEVLIKPEIQYKPTNQIVIQGKTASFYCNATGVPEPTISWRFKHKPKNTGIKLVIDKVQNTGEYEGRYTCIASSRAGKTEDSALLTVLVPPTKKAALQGVMLQLGQTLRLKCDVNGDPKPSFVWTKRLLGKTERIMLPDQKKAELLITDVRIEHAAYYGCTATNSLGNITLKEVFIDVNTSLNIINSDRFFNATEESSTTIICNASSEVFPVKVKLFKDGIELKTRRDVSKDKQVVTARLDLTKVSTDDSGKYTCVASNRQKEVRADVTLTVNVPIKVEMDVSLKNKTFTDELRDNTTQEYRNLTAEFIEEMTKVYRNETGFLRVEVLGFSNGSVSVQFRVVYKIEVKNPEDKPPPDAKVRIANVLVRRVKTSDGIVGKLIFKAESLKPRVKPPAPRNLTAINIKKTSMTIHWSPPLYHDTYSVENYLVKYKQFSNSWKNLEAGGQHSNTLFLEDLEPDTSYSIKAGAVNHVGEGLPSNVIEVKTHSDFWSTFTKVFVPLFVLLLLGVIVLLYIRRRRARTEAKLATTEVEGKRCYDDFHDGEKKIECGGDALEMVELPLRCRSILRDNLVLDKELGSGQFGVVYKGFLKEKGEDEDLPCAVKMLKPGASESDYRDLFNELEIMCSVEEHPNIVNLLGACKGGGGPLYVVVEFAENGCLLDYIRENRITTIDDDGKKDEASSLDNQEKIRIALDIANGMKHLASHKCVHRDLAARNVLLGKDRIAKVADFGLARDVYEQGFYEKSSSGGKLPAKWMSIEALETLKATSESDVWSFGVLLWEIETGGKMPYAGLSYMDLVKALKSGVRLQKPSSCSDELYSIMKDCWEANPEKRPKFEVLTLVLDNLLMAFMEDC